MTNPYNRNNESLFSLPQCLLDKDWIGKRDYTVWSVHTWIREDRFLSSYQVWIKYHFAPDPRGLMRATVKNIWSRSPRLEISCQGVLLEAEELKVAKAEIKDRLIRMFNYKSLVGKKITRYRFNYIAAFPEGNLAGLDCHHESHNNEPMRDYCEAQGIELRDEWFAATDDRVCNLERLGRLQHKLVHFANGDTGFLPYTKAEAYIPNDTLEDCRHTEPEQEFREEIMWVNKGNHWLSGFPTTAMKRMYNRLHRELFGCSPSEYLERLYHPLRYPDNQITRLPDYQITR